MMEMGDVRQRKVPSEVENSDTTDLDVEFKRKERRRSCMTNCLIILSAALVSVVIVVTISLNVHRWQKSNRNMLVNNKIQVPTQYDDYKKALNSILEEKEKGKPDKVPSTHNHGDPAQAQKPKNQERTKDETQNKEKPDKVPSIPKHGDTAQAQKPKNRERTKDETQNKGRPDKVPSIPKHGDTVTAQAQKPKNRERTKDEKQNKKDREQTGEEKQNKDGKRNGHEKAPGKSGRKGNGSR